MLVAMVAACESPTEPIFNQDARVVVHAILDPSTDTQSVVLEWSPGSAAVPSLSNAVVRITPQGGMVQTLTLHQPANPTPGPKRSRFVLTLSGGLGPLFGGRTYTLDVEIPGRPPISGTTTIPDALPNNSPLVHTFPFTHDGDTLRMKWAPVPGAAGYRVMSIGSFQFDGETYWSTLVGVFTDTSATLPGDKQDLNGADFFPVGYTVDVTVLAVDDNYFTYYKTAADPFAGAPPSRLSGGAVGFFGSIVPIHRRRFNVQ